MFNNRIENIRTDNIPLLDELIYNIKKIIYSLVLKDQESADKVETLESQKNADLYILCVENRAELHSFKYSQQDLLDVGVPYTLLEDCLKDYRNIPEKYREALIRNKTLFIIENYEEVNPYYRMLNGVPNIGDKGLKISQDIIPPNIVGIDITKYLHEMTDSEVDILYTFGVIDEVLKKNPTKKYLKYMGSRRISVYDARTAVEAQVIYTPTDIPREVLVRFKEKMEINRVYTNKTIYSDAYKIGSDYYHNFLRSLIVLQTMTDMITELPDMIIKKEIFDIKMVKLIMESNGVDFFPEIPYRYQIAMVRNLNRLIKFKSTTQNIVDICSLFGFDNIEVFKYYLLRHRNVDKYGEYSFHYKQVEDPETGEINTVEDNDKQFDLRFIKVPIDESVDDHIQDRTKYLDYDEVVDSDKYWNGDLEHDFIKSCIVDKEFNYVQSKYLSVDTLYSLSELSFEMTYFYNMIFDDVLVEDQLKLTVPIINGLGVFKFVDILCYLFALMHEYNGVVDDLMDEPNKIMAIKGFNFKVDLPELARYIAEQGIDPMDLGFMNFQRPKNSILTYNQLMEVFRTNKNIYFHIVDQLYKADNKRIYDIYYKIYTSLMITDLNMEFFKKKDGTLAKTYTDFLSDRDPILYNSILEIRKMDSEKVKQEKISNIIDATVYEIEQFIDLKEFKYLFNHLPAVSAEAVKKYVYKVINFFKSYKVHIHSINTVYVFDDKLENKIKMIDEAIINYYFHKQSTIDVLSKITTTSTFNHKEKSEIIEKLYIDFTFWIDKLFNEEMSISIKDKFYSSLISITKRDSIDICDRITITSTIEP